MLGMDPCDPTDGEAIVSWSMLTVPPARLLRLVEYPDTCSHRGQEVRAGAQHPARPGVGVPAVVDDLLAVDEHVLHAERVAVQARDTAGEIEHRARGPGTDRLLVEHGDVGGQADREAPPLVQSVH